MGISQICDQGNGGKQTLIVWFVCKQLFGFQALTRRTDKKRKQKRGNDGIYKCEEYDLGDN